VGSNPTFRENAMRERFIPLFVIEDKTRAGHRTRDMARKFLHTHLNNRRGNLPVERVPGPARVPDSSLATGRSARESLQKILTA
jgi:hypothetical protein